MIGENPYYYKPVYEQKNNQFHQWLHILQYELNYDYFQILNLIHH